MQILQKGENWLHATLTGIEGGVTHFLAVSGNRTFLHRILQTGEVVTTELNVPLLRQVLMTIDEAIPQ